MRIGGEESSSTKLAINALTVLARANAKKLRQPPRHRIGEERVQQWQSGNAQQDEAQGVVAFQHDQAAHE